MKISLCTVRSDFRQASSALRRSLLDTRISGVNQDVNFFLFWMCFVTLCFTMILVTGVAVKQASVEFTPQWGAVDAEIKVPSGENTELKRSPFQAWSRSVYSHTCYAYCQGFLPCLFLPFQSIHLHFFQNLSRLFPVLAVANTGSCVGPQNKIGHPAGCRFPCWVPAAYK